MNKFKLFVFVCSVVLYPVKCFCMDVYDGDGNITPREIAQTITPSTPNPYKQRINLAMAKLIQDTQNEINYIDEYHID